MRKRLTQWAARVWAALALMAVVASAPSALATDAETFAEGSYISHPRLSPDGSLYAMVTYNSGGRPHITVWAREGMQKLRDIEIPKDIWIGWIDFAANETLLISTTTRFRMENNRIYWPSSRVVSVPLTAGREMVVLFQDERRMMQRTMSLNRIVDIMPDQPEMVMMGARDRKDFDLFAVNTHTGASTKMASGSPRTFAWYTDVNGTPTIRMDCVDRRCRKVKALRPKQGGAAYTPKTGWSTFQTFERGDPEDETLLNLQPVGPTANPEEFFVIDGRDGVPRRTVRRYNIRTDSFVETLYQDAEYDVTDAIIDPVTREYQGAQVWRDGLDYVLTDTELQTHLDGINEWFSNEWNVSFYRIAQNRSAAILKATASNERGAYYLYDFATRQTRTLRAINPKLHNTVDTLTTRIDLPMRDGTTITGYHTVKGDGTEPATGPLVVLVHGGPEARDRMDYDRTTQFLAMQGHQVLRLNFRGSSGYGRDFARAGYRQWGGVMHTDVVDATAHMQARGLAAPDSTCVMGYSYGGYAALLAGAMQPQLYACVVAGGGPSDLVQALRDERKDHGRSSQQVAYWEKVIGDPKRDRDALVRASPIRLVERYDDPVLLLHGERDGVVDVQHSRRMRNALQKAGKAVEYVELPGGHYHNRWRSRDRQRYLEAIDDFIEASVGDAPAD